MTDQNPADETFGAPVQAASDVPPADTPAAVAADHPDGTEPGAAASDPSAWARPQEPAAGPAPAEPAGWPAPSGWQTPQGAQYGSGAPAQPAAPWGAPAPGGQAPAWQSQTSAYPPAGGTYPGQAGAPGQAAYEGYGYPGAAGQQGQGAWQHDTSVLGTPSGGYPPPGQPSASPQPGARKPRTGLVLATAAIIGLLAGGLGGYVGAQAGGDSTSGTSVTLPQSGADKSPRADGSVADIAVSVSPAVVSLAVTGQGGAGTGSGFVIREDGYILTNNHVVEAAASNGQVTVNFADDRSLDATIVGRDPAYDLAVIKVDATGLPTVVLGDSDGVVVGDLAIAIGSPLGLDGTVTAGIVSALNRPVTAGGQGSDETSFINAIQTDAAINPGNSGGALVNAAGEVIGVNSAIATLGAGLGGQAGSIGLGFAIPINQAKRIAEELISTGTSTKPIIGVRLDIQYTGDGARVDSVTAGGPAAEAGMRDGDIIVEFDGRPVADSTQLVVDIRSKSPGDQVAVTVQRGGGTEELTITLGSDSSSN
jgi:putative serine protease PepD